MAALLDREVEERDRLEAEAIKQQQEAELAQQQQEAEERKRQEESLRVRNYFTLPDQGLEPEEKQHLDALFASSPHPEEERAQVFITQYLARQYGKPPEEISRHYWRYQNDYVQQQYGTAEMKNTELFGKVKNEYELDNAIAHAAQRSVLANEAPSQAWAAYRFEAIELPGWNDAREKELRSTFMANAKSYEYSLSPYRQFINSSFDALVRHMGLRKDAVAIGAESGLSPDDISREVMKIRKELRPSIFHAWEIKAEAANYDSKGFVQKFGESLYRGTVDLVKGPGDIADRLLIEGRLKLLDHILVPVNSDDPVRDAFAESSRRLWPRLTASGGLGLDLLQLAANLMTDQRNLTDQEKEATTQMLNDELDRIDLAADIRAYTENKLDPVHSEYLVVRGIYGAARSAPAMLAMMAPSGIGILPVLMSTADMNYNKLRRDNPEMSREDALLTAMTAAPLQTGIDFVSTKFLIGRAPSLTKVLGNALSRPLSVGSRFAVRTVENTALELFTENVQDVTPLVIQDLLAALKKDMPGADWDAQFASMKANQWELLATILPLSIIGAGFGTWQDMNQARGLMSSVDAVRSTGLAENHVLAITSAAARGDMDAAQNALRTAYRETDFHSPEVQQRRDAAAGVQRERTQRQQAAIAELEKSGALPVMRRTENGWQVRFNSELVDSFDTYAEANAARWEVFEKSGWEVTQSIRDIISGLESTSPIGREYVYRLKDDEMTLGQAAKEKIASVSQLRQRAQIADRNLSDIDAAYDEAALTTEALSADLSDAEAARRILGSSRTEFKDGVYQTTITLYKGANELTVLEEKIEGDARLLLKDGRKGWMISALRDVEDKTGVSLFRKVADNSQLNNQDVVEAWSSLGVSYFTATSRKGEASTQGGVRPKGLDGVRTRQFFSRVMGTKMGAVLSAYGTFFREVWKQAAALNKARRDGKLDAELESTLRQQLGLRESPSREVTDFRNVDANADLSTFTETSFSQLPLRKQAFYWKQQLGKLFAGTLDKTHPLLFGKTPAVLEAVGADPLPLVMDINVVTKARDKHGLSIRQLQDIFEEVHDPIAVFQSHRLGDSQVVLTSLEHHGEPLIVAVHLDRKVQHHKVNKIESVYAKSVGVVKEWLSDGSTLQYLNTKKSHLLALSRGLQLPKEATLQKGRRQYLTEEDIVNLPDRSEFTRQANPPPQTSDTASPESNTKNKLGGNTFALAPLGIGSRPINSAPKLLSQQTNPFNSFTSLSASAWRKKWNEWVQINRTQWLPEKIIRVPEGDISITKQTLNHLRSVRDGESPALHFEAATRLPELLENSVLAAVDPPKSAEVTASEIHRRYAWMVFADGKVRNVLLTIKRWKESANTDYDTAYSMEALEVEELVGGISPDTFASERPTPTSPQRKELNSFLTGIKPEHKTQQQNTASIQDASVTNATAPDQGQSFSTLDSNDTGGINENREETTQIHHRSGRNAQSLAQAAARLAGGSDQVYFGPEQSASYPERREAQVKLLANEPEAPAQSGEPTFVGGEHKVYIPNIDQPTVVIKHTLPGEFGRVMDEKSILNPRTMQMERKLTLRPALPSEYARRWAVVSDEFGLDVEVQGRVSGTKNQLSMIQPFITQDIDDPATTADVTGFMEANGFTKVDPKLIAIPEVADVTWYRQRDGILVTDAHPRNFRLTLNSEVVPIDVIITTVPKGASKLLADPTSPWGLSELTQGNDSTSIQESPLKESAESSQENNRENKAIGSQYSYRSNISFSLDSLQSFSSEDVKKLKPRPKGIPSWEKLLVDWVHILERHTVDGKVFIQSGIKTAFPDNWNKSTIEKALIQAWKNAQKTKVTSWGATSLIGYTKEGTPIEFWYDSENKKIETAYIKGRIFKK